VAPTQGRVEPDYRGGHGILANWLLSQLDFIERERERRRLQGEHCLPKGLGDEAFNFVRDGLGFHDVSRVEQGGRRQGGRKDDISGSGVFEPDNLFIYRDRCYTTGMIGTVSP
jgi:hypothetical protein